MPSLTHTTHSHLHTPSHPHTFNTIIIHIPTHHTHHIQTHLPHTLHTQTQLYPIHTTSLHTLTPSHTHTVTLSLTWSVLRMRGGDLDCRRHVFSFIQFLQHTRHKRKRHSTHNTKVQAATITRKKNRVTFILKRAQNRFSFKNIKA